MHILYILFDTTIDKYGNLYNVRTIICSLEYFYFRGFNLTKNNSMHFFLASNSPRGFFSKMDIFSKNLPKNWKCNVIKGSPGCGKSTYMKKIADEMKQMNATVEYIHCPSDPDSLDAVIFPDLKLCYVDGTSPHIIDPIFPGITGNIIDLAKLKSLDSARKNKNKIFKLNKKSEKFYNQAQKYLLSFRSILSNSIEEHIENINFDHIKSMSEKISKKYFTKKLTKIPKKSLRMISSVGPKGLLLLNQNFDEYKSIYQIDDDLNLESDILFRYILNLASNYGYNSIVCINPISLNEKIESLIFPELKLTFFAKNRWQTESCKFKKNVNKIKICKKNQIHADDQDILDILMLKAIQEMKKVLDIHLKIEKAYQ